VFEKRVLRMERQASWLVIFHKYNDKAMNDKANRAHTLHGREEDCIQSSGGKFERIETIRTTKIQVGR
jgi:hypothetical protein